MSDQPKRTWEVKVKFSGVVVRTIEADTDDQAGDKAHDSVKGDLAFAGLDDDLDIEVESCVQLAGPPPDPCPDEAPFDLHLADGRVLTMPGCVEYGAGPWRKIVDRPGWWTDRRCVVNLAQDPPETHQQDLGPVKWRDVEEALPTKTPGLAATTTGEDHIRDYFGNTCTYRRWTGCGLSVAVATHYSRLLEGEGVEVMVYGKFIPVVARRDGELVAVVMPVRGD